MDGVWFLGLFKYEDHFEFFLIYKFWKLLFYFVKFYFNLKCSILILETFNLCLQTYISKLETILISKKSFFFLRISILFWKHLFQIGIFYFLLENIILFLETSMLLQRPFVSVWNSLFPFGKFNFIYENFDFHFGNF